LLREKIKTLNQDAPVAIAKGMLLLKEMPSWMNYAQSHLREGMEGIEKRVTTDISSLKISLIMSLGII
jgi:hypothetical protein